MRRKSDPHRVGSRRYPGAHDPVLWPELAEVRLSGIFLWAGWGNRAHFKTLFAYWRAKDEGFWPSQKRRALAPAKALGRKRCSRSSWRAHLNGGSAAANGGLKRPVDGDAARRSGTGHFYFAGL